MNKSESKYYNTALLMNQALVELLQKKDLDYVTVKEICEKAGVNRSTFYLHYETIDDLLQECIDNTNKRFLEYFTVNSASFCKKLAICSKQELILITPEYLTPYLEFIRDNKVLHQVAVRHRTLMHSDKKFVALNRHVFKPIFDRFDVDEKTANYMIKYYLNGITAIINEWINGGCADEIEFVEKIIIDCVRPI